MELLDKIINNQTNLKFFEFIQLSKHTNVTLSNGELVSAFDDGGKIFFDKYSKTLPEGTKRILHENILVNEDSGEIFAFHFGRFTFVFKCDFERNGIRNSFELQTGFTLDDWIDIRPLGRDWAILNSFGDEDDIIVQLEWAYDLTKKNWHRKSYAAEIV